MKPLKINENTTNIITNFMKLLFMKKQNILSHIYEAYKILEKYYKYSHKFVPPKIRERGIVILACFMKLL